MNRKTLSLDWPRRILYSAILLCAIATVSHILLSGSSPALATTIGTEAPALSDADLDQLLYPVLPDPSPLSGLSSAFVQLKPTNFLPVSVIGGY